MRTAIFLAAAGAAVGVSAIDLASLRPISTARYSNNEDVAADGNTRLLRREDYVETAKELVKSVAPDATFRVIDDHYVGANGFSHVYFYQTADDVDIDGAFFNVNVGGFDPHTTVYVILNHSRSTEMGTSFHMAIPSLTGTCLRRIR